jgi:hypothetical protein
MFQAGADEVISWLEVGDHCGHVNLVDGISATKDSFVKIFF